jgi:hypothetical protein
VEPNGGNGTANTTAAGDDIQVVASGAAVAAGGLIIAPGANGVLDTSASDDDFVRAATDVLVPAIVPTGLDCSTCPLGDCVVNCGLCAAGFCVGDDVLLARSAGQSCEDDVCPCGTCVSGSQFDEWIFSTTLEAD